MDEIFIFARILLLSTGPDTPFLSEMMEKNINGSSVVEILSAKMESMIEPVQRKTKLAVEAMSDLLKWAFRLVVFYPAVCVSLSFSVSLLSRL